MNRRSALKSILLAGVAPFFVPADRLMRIKPIVVPEASMTAGYFNSPITYRLYVIHADGTETLLSTATTPRAGWVELSEPFHCRQGDTLAVSWTQV